MVVVGAAAEEVAAEAGTIEPAGASDVVEYAGVVDTAEVVDIAEHAGVVDAAEVVDTAEHAEVVEMAIGPGADSGAVVVTALFEADERPPGVAEQ